MWCAGEVESGAEFLVKWTGRSHLHNEWVPQGQLARLAKRKLDNFRRRCGEPGEVPCACSLHVAAWEVGSASLVCQQQHAPLLAWTLRPSWAHARPSRKSDAVQETACALLGVHMPCLLKAETCCVQAERLVARRPSPTGPGWEVLVKWCKLDYSQATWEVQSPVLACF